MAAIGAESLLVHGGLVSGYRVMFYLPYLWKFPFPELWRLITPFLLTGGGFNALWDIYMFWTYATQLELNSPRFTQPGDFATYVGFIAISILVSPSLSIVDPVCPYTSPFCPFRNLCLIRFLVSEEDYPCVTYCPVIRKIPKGFMWRRHGGGPLRKAACIHELLLAVVASYIYF